MKFKINRHFYRQGERCVNIKTKKYFSGVFLISFILVVEMVGPKERVYCGNVIQIYFVLGGILAAGLAYWQRDWRIVVIIATVPVCLFLLYWPFLPESTR
jgi:OCT family organic cation transporter-like MFS transporter 4/5